MIQSNSTHDIPPALQFEGGPTSVVVISSGSHMGWTFIRLSDSLKWIIIPISNAVLEDVSVNYYPILIDAWTNTDWNTLTDTCPINKDPVPYGGRYNMKGSDQ